MIVLAFSGAKFCSGAKICAHDCTFLGPNFSGAKVVLVIVLFLALKVAMDLIHWAFISWSSACVIYMEPLLKC